MTKLLAELAGEALWDQTLAESAEAVDTLAQRALKEHRAGREKR